jgi:hypothetical protein
MQSGTRKDGIIMRRLIFVTLVVALSCAGQKDHPISVDVEPAMEEGRAEKIAVFPFLSALHNADDPDNLAPEMMDRYFTPALDARNDYTFISPGTVRFAIEGHETLEPQYNKFLDEYPRKGKIDPEFFGRLAEALNADAFLIPVVDMWQKDEVDYQEDATPTTYVGATITVTDRTGQEILFRAVDEDYIEGARSETSGRGVVSTHGRVRSDAGSKAYRAPPYDEVAIKVITALVGSLPAQE